MFCLRAAGRVCIVTCINYDFNRSLAFPTDGRPFAAWTGYIQTYPDPAKVRFVLRYEGAVFRMDEHREARCEANPLHLKSGNGVPAHEPIIFGGVSFGAAEIS